MVFIPPEPTASPLSARSGSLSLEPRVVDATEPFLRHLQQATAPASGPLPVPREPAPDDHSSQPEEPSAAPAGATAPAANAYEPAAPQSSSQPAREPSSDADAVKTPASGTSGEEASATKEADEAAADAPIKAKQRKESKQPKKSAEEMESVVAGDGQKLPADQADPHAEQLAGEKAAAKDTVKDAAKDAKSFAAKAELQAASQEIATEQLESGEELAKGIPVELPKKGEKKVQAPEAGRTKLDSAAPPVEAPTTAKGDNPLAVPLLPDGGNPRQEESEPKRQRRGQASAPAVVADATGHPSAAPAARGAANPPATLPTPAEVPAESAAAADVSSTSSQSRQPSGQPQEAVDPSSKLPQHLWARGGQRAAKGEQLSQADQTRFLQRVARALESMQGKPGELRLRLSPPELGSLRLEIKVQNGVMHARLEAETTVARTILLDHLPVLRERLAEQGVRIDQFDVDLMDQPHQQTDESAQQEERQSHSRSDRTSRHDRKGPAQAPTAHPVDTAHWDQQGRLNIII